MRTIGLHKVLQSLGCLIGYALAYYLTREASIINWQLAAGVRFAAFLFLPYRLWPMIFLGDMAGSAAYRWNVIGSFGWLWLAITLLGSPAAAAASAALLRHLRFRNWRLGLSQKATGVLQAAGVASLLNALAGIAAMDAIHYSPSTPKMEGAPAFFMSVFMLGNYLGILMVAPAIMTLQVLRTHKQTFAVSEVQRLMVDFWPTTVKAAIALLFLLLINRFVPDERVQAAAALLMLAPAVYLTYLQGWSGAIAATILANIALGFIVRRHMTTPDGLVNTQVLTTQVLMAIVCTALQLFGARMTEDKVRQSIVDKEHRRTLQAARQNLMWGESRIRQTALLVERAFASVQRFIDQASIELGSNSSPNAIATLRWATTGLVRHEARQEASALHLTALETYGLQMALITGPIAQALSDAHIAFPVRVASGVADLSSDTQVHLYRLTHDLVMRLATEFNASRVSVRMRLSGRGTVALVVKAWPGYGSAPNLLPYHSEIDQLRAFAHSYRGLFHDRRRRRRPVMSLLLHDH